MNFCNVIYRQSNWLFPIIGWILPFGIVIRLLFIFSPFASCFFHLISRELDGIMGEGLRRSELLEGIFFFCCNRSEFCSRKGLRISHRLVIFKKFDVVIKLLWFNFVDNDNFTSVFVAKSFTFASYTNIFWWDKGICDSTCDSLHPLFKNLLGVLLKSWFLDFTEVWFELIHQWDQSFIVIIWKRISFLLSMEITDTVLHLLGRPSWQFLCYYCIVCSIDPIVFAQNFCFIFRP